MPEFPGIIDPSVGTFAGELRDEPRTNFLEMAIRKFARKNPLYPGGPGFDPGTIVETMDPEIRNTVMGFGPGQLPTAAGIFKSNIANAVRKGLAEYYPSTGGRKHVARLMDMLREIPQSVMDRIEKFTLTGERPVYPKKMGGTASALGVYHPVGQRETFRWGPEGTVAKEVKKESARLLPEVEVQGIDIAKGRTGQDVVGTAIHEISGHGVVDAIRRKVGWRGSEQLAEVGTKDPFFGSYLKYGREEPFAKMVEELSPGEYRELMEPYFKGLKESPGTRIHTLPERQRVDKAIRRAHARVVKEKGASKTAEKIPTVEGLKYNGIQKIPDYPDQYVFTDKKTGSTFYTFDKTPGNLIKERDRMRAAFESAE